MRNIIYIGTYDSFVILKDTLPSNYKLKRNSRILETEYERIYYCSGMSSDSTWIRGMLIHECIIQPMYLVDQFVRDYIKMQMQITSVMEKK